jgi:hypothetical protein
MNGKIIVSKNKIIPATSTTKMTLVLMTETNHPSSLHDSIIYHLQSKERSTSNQNQQRQKAKFQKTKEQ